MPYNVAAQKNTLIYIDNKYNGSYAFVFFRYKTNAQIDIQFIKYAVSVYTWSKYPKPHVDISVFYICSENSISELWFYYSIYWQLNTVVCNSFS